ncbi:hypothetical protein LX36DRAFT_313694 [Colletotrichum falcatum]|nr:hypothetical protein LX36DRAFT_313694 [Colletotrichum falcatum]
MRSSYIGLKNYCASRRRCRRRRRALVSTFEMASVVAGYLMAGYFLSRMGRVHAGGFRFGACRKAGKRERCLEDLAIRGEREESWLLSGRGNDTVRRGTAKKRARRRRREEKKIPRRSTSARTN